MTYKLEISSQAGLIRSRQQIRARSLICLKTKIIVARFKPIDLKPKRSTLMGLVPESLQKPLPNHAENLSCTKN